MKITVTRLAGVMQTLMTITADQVGQASGFVQRRSKMSAAVFIQSLVFGWLAQPSASRAELSQTAAAAGIAISAQGLDERMNERAVVFLRQMVEETIGQVLCSDPMAVAVFQRFNGVYVIDSTVIILPSALAEMWPGCGDGQAALKLPVELNLSTGALRVYLEAGRVHDQRTAIQAASLPASALRLADLGFFDLDVLHNQAEQGVFWLVRFKTGTILTDHSGQRLELVAALQAASETLIDWPVILGAVHHLPCRLIAQRVPPATAEERRRKTRQEARRRGQTPSQTRLALADWTVFLTNVPVTLMTAAEALVVATARWQIELLFKLWKSHGHLAQSRSSIPHKILCEVYAKLIAVVIQHWLCLVRLWSLPDHSLVKAAQTIRKHALGLVKDLPVLRLLTRSIRILTDCLAAGCRIDNSRRKPATFQRLLALT
jgi:hypothetical protein